MSLKLLMVPGIAVMLAGSIMLAQRVESTPGDRIESMEIARPGKEVGQALSTSVSLKVKDSTVLWTINRIAQMAGIKPSFFEVDTLVSKKISVEYNRVKALDALNDIAKKAGLEIKTMADGESVVISERKRATPSPTQDKETTSVRGKVTDLETKEPLSGVTVEIAGVKGINAVTGREGTYLLRNVPVQKSYMIRFKLIGYKTVTVEVSDGALPIANASLEPSANILSGVVTTATGEQKKLEVGHSIVSLNVDSIMQTAPVGSVTDLLESRVPGMMVQRTSGSPGDPARIRLRGTSSIHQNNDPIIVVDGIRIYSEQSEERNQNTGNGTSYATPSPLDQIDPNTIEKLEVLKGPSASALYGSDAANGVIVITTKRGQSGPPRWNVAANTGLSYMPGKWPTSTFQWVTPLHGGLPELCVGFCGDATIDSVFHFQALNDPRLTALGRGSKLGGTATVSGGASTVNYSFTGSAGRERGILKLPKVEEERYLKNQGEPAPGWMKRPDLLENRGFQGNVQVQLGSNSSITVSSVLNQQTQKRTSMSSATNTAINTLQRLWIDQSQLYETPILGNPYERVTVNITTLTNSARLSLRPYPWLPIISTFGLSSSNEHGEMSVARGLPIVQPVTTDYSGGAWRGNVKSSTGMTGNVSSVMPLMERIQLAVGVNYTSRANNDQSGAMFGVPIGVTDPAVGEDSVRNQFRRSTSETASFGWFIEPRLNVRSRFFVTPGFRLDNNGLSGKNAGLNSLPKMNFSWLASEESFFPFKEIIPMLRVRTAFGVSGVQPKPGDLDRLYRRITVDPLTGTEPLYGEMLSLNYLGNTKLRPERGVEWEGGVDMELWNNRLNIDITAYHKRRTDAIIENNYASSVEGGGKIKMNVGDIDNYGLELGVSSQIIENRMIGVNMNMSFSQNRSKVVRLSEDGEAIRAGVGGSRFLRWVAGYPMEGMWEFPILGYLDLDGNGWLSKDEVFAGSDPVYLGSSEPRYQAAFSPLISVWRGRVNGSANLSYTSGQLQSLSDAGGIKGTLGWYPWESNLVPGEDGFDRQAAMVGQQFSPYTVVGFMQRVNVLRLQSVSINLNLGQQAVRFFKARSASLALQGSNLGLWSNYVGVDPNVNASFGSGLSDRGQQPQPRSWQLRLALGY